MTFFCEFALLFCISVKFWPILYSELYNLPVGCVERVFLLLFESPYFWFHSMIFFSSALEKVITVVNYFFHAAPVIYFPDLNRASLLLIQNLMYPYIWIIWFFSPVLRVLKLIYMHFETRGTTTTHSGNENPYSGIMLVSVFSFSPASLQLLMKAGVIMTVTTCYS